MCVWLMLLAAANLITIGGLRLSKAGPKGHFSLLASIADASIYYIERNEPHPKTIEAVTKHCNTWQSYVDNHEVAPHTKVAFREACDFVNAFYAVSHPIQQDNYQDHRHQVILDSGCGKGKSTRALARQFPSMPVIGIDRSVVRLSHTGLYDGVKPKNDEDDDDKEVDDDNDKEDMSARPPNLLLVRAELADFWLLAAMQSDWQVHKHFLLYPNPYPKLKHLQRRWHGHPVFPAFLALGGEIVVRSNWKVYCQEMEMCMRFVTEKNNECATTYPKLIGGRVQLQSVAEYLLASPDDAITHFERKYVISGVPLFELRVNWGSQSPGDRRRALGLV